MTHPQHTSSPPPSPRVGLFVTCLVDAMRPSVGFAALKLLRDAGCRVEIPQAQTCCGQPARSSSCGLVAAVWACRVLFCRRVPCEGNCSRSTWFISAIALLGINAFRRKKRVILF